MGNSDSCCFSFRDLLFLSLRFFLSFSNLLCCSSPYEFRTKLFQARFTLWFSNVAGLFRLLCLEPLEHTVKAQPEARVGFRAFSLSITAYRPLPLAPSTALTVWTLVFSHGLLSQPRVSLIINDPEGGGPLKVLDLAA